MNPSKCLVILTLSAAVAAGVLVSRSAQASPETEPTPQASAHSTTDAHPSGSALAGAWRLAETADEEQERHRAIDGAVRGMPSMVQSRARSRLAERTAPPSTLEIEIEGARLVLTGEKGQIELELDGESVRVSEGRETTQMRARMEQDSLRIEAQGSRGGRTTIYKADGARLTVRTTIRGNRLPEAVTYATTYARSE